MATDHEESVAIDKNEVGSKGPSSLTLENMAVGPESPRESRGGKVGDEATRAVSRKEGVKGKAVPARLSHIVEIMAVGLESL